MPVRKHKQAVFLENQPYTVKSYFRSVTDDLVSRFGSAESGQTNLDLLKALTQKGYRGGMFQRNFDDPEKASTISNAYYNKLDQNLYPTPLWRQAKVTTGYFVPDGSTKSAGTSMNGGGATSWCFWRGEYYITFQSSLPGPIVNHLQMIDPVTGIITAITLPAALLNNASPLKLTAYGDYIFIGTSLIPGSTTAHRWDGTTFVNVTGNIRDFAVFNEKLYGITPIHEFYAVTNHTAATVTYTLVSFIGGVKSDNATTGLSYYHMCIEFNGALYIGTEYGLFRYDGVSISTVLDFSKAQHSSNFRKLAVFNGRLYYVIKNKLYQFDGTNIEELQDFTDADVISDMVGGTDRLWISTKANTGVAYSDKWNPAGSPVYEVSAFCYDGVGFFRYNTFADDLPIEYTNVAIIPATGYMNLVIPDVYLNFSLEERSNGYNLYCVNLADEFTTTRTGAGFQVVSSIMDCNYPSVAKVANGIMTNFAGLTDGEGRLMVEFQYYLDGAWSEWFEVWNTENQSADGATNDYQLHEQVKNAAPHLETAPGVYHKIRTRTTLELDDTSPTTLPYLSDQTVRYTIQPRLRLKWLLELELTGVDTRDITTPNDSSGARETRTASQLRKIIYDAYRNKIPLLFYDLDYTEVKDDDPLVFKGVDFITPGDTVAIQDAIGDEDPWINRRVGAAVYDDVDDETAITLDQIGYRVGIGGSENTALQIDAQVRKSHAVYIRGIRGERVLLDSNTLNDKSTGHSDISSVITLDLVEV